MGRITELEIAITRVVESGSGINAGAAGDLLALCADLRQQEVDARIDLWRATRERDYAREEARSHLKERDDLRVRVTKAENESAGLRENVTGWLENIAKVSAERDQWRDLYHARRAENAALISDLERVKAELLCVEYERDWFKKLNLVQHYEWEKERKNHALTNTALGEAQELVKNLRGEITFLLWALKENEQ